MRTREALRQAMTELAAESPLEAITVRAIAARAGVGYATFFRHYADKDALLAEVSEILIREFLTQVRPLMMIQQDRGGRRPLAVPIRAGPSGDPQGAALARRLWRDRAGGNAASGDDGHGRLAPAPADGPMDDLLLFHVVTTIPEPALR